MKNFYRQILPDTLITVEKHFLSIVSMLHYIPFNELGYELISDSFIFMAQNTLISRTNGPQINKIDSHVLGMGGSHLMNVK